jgi:hypothetical protein
VAVLVLATDRGDRVEGMMFVVACLTVSIALATAAVSICLRDIASVLRDIRDIILTDLERP